MLILHYQGKQDDRALTNINREIDRHSPENKKVQVSYTGTKLGSKINAKDVTKKEQQHDLVCSVKCPLEICDESCNGEIERRLAERVSDHSVRDKSSPMYKYSIEKVHPTVKLQDFEVLSIQKEGFKGTFH